MTNREDDFNPDEYIDQEEGYDSDDALIFLEVKKENSSVKNANFQNSNKNDSTRINDSVNNSKYFDQKQINLNNIVRSSKSVSEKIRENTKNLQNNYGRPPIYRESISKGEVRNNKELINLHKNDLMNVNKSVIINPIKSTEDRAKMFDRNREENKNKVK